MSVKAVDHVVESEVLVVGSGLAGSLAAIKCHQLGSKVAIANKAAIVGGGATSIIGGRAMNVCFPTDDKDFWIKKFLDVGGHELDQEWLKIHLEETYDYVIELDHLGQQYREAIFPRDPLDKNGGFWRLQPWAVEVVSNAVFDGSAAEAAFKKKILADKIPVFQRMEMTSLLRDGERILGAIGFDYRNGETYLFKAKAVILACGGVRFGDNVCNNSGEGISMAYEAGANIRSLGKERARLKPRFGTREGALGDHFHTNGLTYPWGAKIVNRLGEAFMEKYPAGTNLEDTIRVEEALRKEIAEGRGPIYEDWTQIPPEIHEILKTFRKPHWKLTKLKFGVDAFKDLAPFSEQGEQVYMPGRTMHFGPMIDYQCASNIPGLYALGDNAASYAGKTPFHGGGTAWALLTGSRVGRFVKEFVASAPGIAAKDKEILAQAKEHIANLALPLTGSSGLSPDEVSSNFLRCLIPFDQISSKKELLEKALSEIVRLQEDSTRIKAKDFHELKKACEIKSQLVCAEIILRSQLFKEEGRMPHKDFPTWTMVKKLDGRMHVYGKDIPLPLHITP